jgi:hypothetical protein
LLGGRCHLGRGFLFRWGFGVTAAITFERVDTASSTLRAIYVVLIAVVFKFTHLTSFRIGGLIAQGLIPFHALNDSRIENPLPDLHFRAAGEEKDFGKGLGLFDVGEDLHLWEVKPGGGFGWGFEPRDEMTHG